MIPMLRSLHGLEVSSGSDLTDNTDAGDNVCFKPVALWMSSSSSLSSADGASNDDKNISGSWGSECDCWGWHLVEVGLETASAKLAAKLFQLKLKPRNCFIRLQSLLLLRNWTLLCSDVTVNLLNSRECFWQDDSNSTAPKPRFYVSCYCTTWLLCFRCMFHLWEQFYSYLLQLLTFAFWLPSTVSKEVSK